MVIYKRIVLFTCLLTLHVFWAATTDAKPNRRTLKRAAKMYEKSVAFVIGVNSYEHGWPPLLEAAHDAKQIATVLKDKGFDVTLLLNEAATKSTILKHLQTELPPKLSKKTHFLFYFAGHGQTYKTPSGVKQGFIVPVDGKLESDRDALHTYVSMSELKEVFTSYLPSKHNSIIFDSCFSGLMLTRGLKMKSPSFKSKKLTYGVNILSAGAQNEKAADGLFTPTLINGLKGSADANRDGMITFAELSNFTQKKVKSSNPHQPPQFGNLAGDGQAIFLKKRMKRGRLKIIGSLKPIKTSPKRSQSLFVTESHNDLFIEETNQVSLTMDDTRPAECGVRSLASQALGLAQFLGKKYCGDIEDRFEEKSNSTYDHFLKLTWHRLSFEKVSYEDAILRCQKKGIKYRLPKLKELVSLVTNKRSSGGYMPEVVNSLREVWLWAESPLDEDGQQSSVDFSAGEAYQEYFKSLRAYICVSE
jgi:uncharacterized caspase-like protein